eukprot:1313907-Rhodomonas_salina.2
MECPVLTERTVPPASPRGSLKRERERERASERERAWKGFKPDSDVRSEVKHKKPHFQSKLDEPEERGCLYWFWSALVVQPECM